MCVTQCCYLKLNELRPLRMAAKRLRDELKIDMKFNANFNPNQPRRKSIESTKSTHDAKGRIRETKKNVCDCLDNDCVGCHFACKQCRSTKCGPVCRQNRYDYTARIHTEGEKHKDDVHNPNFN